MAFDILYVCGAVASQNVFEQTNTKKKENPKMKTTTQKRSNKTEKNSTQFAFNCF